MPKASEMVQWTISSDERPERKRRATGLKRLYEHNFLAKLNFEYPRRVHIRFFKRLVMPFNTLVVDS